MKLFYILQMKANNKMGAAFAAMIVFLVAKPAYAQEVIKNINALIGIHYMLSTVIPIISAIIFLFLLIIYILRLIAKDTFKRWALSIIIAAAAFYISNALLHLS
ncbi:conjugal transfer protein [Bartonella sp. B41]